MSAAAQSPLYIKIAESLTQQMKRGTLRGGDRAPSLRQLSQQRGVSMSTALQAYLWLESRGYLEARPQSGFYVRTPYSSLIAEPKFESARAHAPVGSTNALWSDILKAVADPANIPFGAGTASPELYPNRRLSLIMRRIIHREPLHSARYVFPPGLEELRRQIARRAASGGCTLAPSDIIVTCGALEAINLCLRAVARPGDVIAVESPTFFGILESATSIGLKIVEIPTHPQEGMDLAELDRAIKKHRVKACITMPNCHNPLGFVLADAHKKSLVDLTARANVALIEDDIYGDLAFSGHRPRTAKAFDRKGLVLLCSSFSKILTPGMRLGWVSAGRYQGEVEHLKFVSTVASGSLAQETVAEFLSSGGYERHLKKLRLTLAGQVDCARQAIAKYFPEGTRISRPSGGHMLWLELPARIDALKLYRAALAERITVLPGPIFSVTGRYKNYIRINCGHRWTEEHDRALLTLGRLAE